MIAVFGEVFFLEDERLKRLGDALFDQDRLTVQTLHGDVRQRAGDSLAQDGVGAVFVGFIGRADLHVDIGMLLVELGQDLFIGHIEQVRCKGKRTRW